MNQKTIYIIDDNADFRQSTQWWLTAADYCVESFESSTKALDRLTLLLKNDGNQNESGRVCLLMDVRMPKMSGLDLHDALQARGLYPPVIYMTGHGAISLAVEAMKKGAVTFLEKPFDVELLQSALDIAFSRKPIEKKEISPELNNTGNAPPIKSQISSEKKLYQQRYARLTPREREVLQAVVDGKLNKVIADKLSISIKTVEVHRARLIKKLEAKNLPEMVKMVITGSV